MPTRPSSLRVFLMSGDHAIGKQDTYDTSFGSWKHPKGAFSAIRSSTPLLLWDPEPMYIGVKKMMQFHDLNGVKQCWTMIQYHLLDQAEDQGMPLLQELFVGVEIDVGGRINCWDDELMLCVVLRTENISDSLDNLFSICNPRDFDTQGHCLLCVKSS
ncbi:uncharacterized protein LOC104584359 isoform X1 [Brachypodium distachyon]|uniref:uncharacterized protein LOC104584359 isoform X1 n=1 Tax=Brachypodium distachyon TaxID=15368 RepID=UPI00071C8FD3|nr:uncharacterized protein LOC104584359 isoform X1 [Brachypodium distachyon]|eukprot:XP_014758100.1 uncharacterized protein LOC104584359 isoform X1 [Brachypodium distachyon]